MDQDFKVRERESQADESFLEEMDYRSWRIEFIRDRDVPEEEARTMWRKFKDEAPLDPFSPGHQVYFAEAPGGSTAGVIWLAEHEPFYVFSERLAWVYNLHVLPQYRGMGVGRLLLMEADGWAAGRGFTSIGLHVADFNTPARRLYESAGYRLVGSHDWSRFYEKKVS